MKYGLIGVLAHAALIGTLYAVRSLSWHWYTPWADALYICALMSAAVWLIAGVAGLWKVNSHWREGGASQWADQAPVRGFDVSAWTDAEVVDSIALAESTFVAGRSQVQRLAGLALSWLALLAVLALVIVDLRGTIDPGLDGIGWPLAAVFVLGATWVVWQDRYLRLARVEILVSASGERAARIRGAGRSVVVADAPQTLLVETERRQRGSERVVDHFLPGLRRFFVVDRLAGRRLTVVRLYWDTDPFAFLRGHLPGAVTTGSRSPALRAFMPWYVVRPALAIHLAVFALVFVALGLEIANLGPRG